MIFVCSIFQEYVNFKPLGEVFTQNILNGTVSDDTCKESPCENGGTCEITWNDFRCGCPDGYDGKVCEVLLPCATLKCPPLSKCHNLGWHGFECKSDAAFDGRGTASPHYRFITQNPLNISLNESSFRYIKMFSLKIVLKKIGLLEYFHALFSHSRWRSKDGGNVLYLSNDKHSFAVALENDRPDSGYNVVAVYVNRIRYVSVAAQILDGQWHELKIAFPQEDSAVGDPVVLEFDGSLLPLNTSFESISKCLDVKY